WQTLEIDYFADTGWSTTILLKNELMRRYPYIQLHNAELVKVTAEARSRGGSGSIELMVSGRSQDIEGVSYRLETVELNNYARYDHGTWQLRVNGEMYISRITVTIEEGWNGGGGGGGYPPGPRPPVP